MIMKRLLLAAGLCLLSAPAWAACAVTNLQVKDNAAVTANVPYADDGSGASNCSPQVQIKQGGHVAGVTAGSALQVDGSATTQPISGTVNPGNIANTTAWLFKLGDGTNGPVAVKPASTAAAVGDASAVITVSPNTVAMPASQSGTWNLNNISGTVSLPTGAATSALQPTNAAQGSTTAGQTGHLMQGAVTTGSPTYTTAQTSPLSLDTAGNLRVNVVAGGASGGTSSNFGSAFPTPGTAIGVKNGANMVNLTADASNNLNVNLNTASAGTYGTAPGAVAALNVNSFVTNALSPGQATMANSAPTVLASNQVCTKTATISMSTATTTQIVAASGSTDIQICDTEISANGATNIHLTKGTGTNCGTGTGQVGQTWYASAAGWAKAAPNNFYRGLDTGASQALCVTSSAAQTVDITVYYNQL